jgi:hypothetical protein
VVSPIRAKVRNVRDPYFKRAVFSGDYVVIYHGPSVLVILITS